MFARIVRYQVSAEHLEETLERFREAAAEIESLDGFEHGYLLADRESGLVITNTIWRDRSALDASDVKAGALRQRAISDVEGSVESVHRVEVVTELGARVGA